MLTPFTPSTVYLGQDSAKPSYALPSPKLWINANGRGVSADGYGTGRHWGDDFGGFGIGTAVAANVGYYSSEGGTYKSYEDTGGSVAGVATNGGVVRLSVDADDDQECWLQYGSSGGTLCALSETAGSNKMTIFEARWKVSTVVGSLFVGLTEEAFAANSAISDAGAISDKDVIGFFVTEGAATSLTFMYKKAGQTAQTVLTWGTAIAADTWYKTGFIYNPNAPASQRITAYINNTEQTTYVTATAMAAATFPDAQSLTFSGGTKNVTDIKTMDFDWWHLWQAA